MKLFGVIPPMVTPFKENGDVDFDALQVLVLFLRDRVDGLFVCGSYGSGPMMSLDERMAVTEKTLEFVDDKLPVVVHTGAASSRDAARLSSHAAAIGAVAVSAVAPYYFHHNSEGVLEYYRAIMASVPPNYPVYVYHNPRFSGYEIDMKTMRELADIGIAGVKDATFDIAKFSAYRRDLAPHGFDVVLGTESIWLSARALGAEAFIPGLANAFPELCTRLHREGMKDDYGRARETQFTVNKIRDIMYLAGSTQQAVYAMLSIRGIVQSRPRSPFLAASADAITAMKKSLDELGVL